MRLFKFIILALITGALFYVMEKGVLINHTRIAPLGKFTSPFTGFWKNAEEPQMKLPQELKLEGLENTVEVFYDDRLVPHIFAQNDHDLYYTQGYITAQHRLWQMEFQTHFAAGRISELIGPRALMLDRMARRKGLLASSIEALKRLEEHPLTDQVLTAYTNGVNAYISSLTYKDYPIEYKLLDYRPEPWSKLKCALLLKYMSDMLTGTSYDIQYTNAIAMLGEGSIGLLYPEIPDTLGSPVIPPGTPFKANHFDLDTPSVPGIYNQIPIAGDIKPANIGSNNWAVSGKKTQSGAPILCNDPHLQLNLPSIWFEVQLSTPEFNAYGVSLPGAPAIVIGFNNAIAWGVTNGTQDVQDWYKVKFRDASMAEYWFDNQWMNTEMRIDTIKIRGKRPFIDTVYSTHFGPVVYDRTNVKDTAAANLAMRWTGVDPSNELITFYKLNRARNYEDYLEAIKTFECPAQNFVFASQSGDIAIWQQGKFPLRWPQQGKFVMDGSLPAYQWQGFIPQDENPHVFNPPRNFVSSANQHPTDKTYPYYYNGVFEHYRNRRINERLENMSGITVEDMMRLQNDYMNLTAADCLPVLLKLIDENELNNMSKPYLTVLREWNYLNEPGSLGASVFNEWFAKLSLNIWDELIDTSNVVLKAQRPYAKTPTDYVTVLMMLRDPNNKYFDRVRTPEAETLKDLVNFTFVEAVGRIETWKNDRKKDPTWANFKNTSVQHLLRLLPFSESELQIGGGGNIVNACTERWGPSWRMVVSMEQPVKAYGVYPGGQSGNPGSRYYTTGIDKWAKGEYFELLFMSSSSDQDERIMFKQKLSR